MKASRGRRTLYKRTTRPARMRTARARTARARAAGRGPSTHTPTTNRTSTPRTQHGHTGVRSAKRTGAGSAVPRPCLRSLVAVGRRHLGAVCVALALAKCAWFRDVAPATPPPAGAARRTRAARLRKRLLRGRRRPHTQHESCDGITSVMLEHNYCKLKTCMFGLVCTEVGVPFAYKRRC